MVLARNFWLKLVSDYCLLAWLFDSPVFISPLNEQLKLSSKSEVSFMSAHTDEGFLLFQEEN